VEKFICAQSSLRKQDQKVEHLIAQASHQLPANAAKLKRDQANWRAHRDAQVWNDSVNGYSSPGDDLRQMYRERRWYLRGLLTGSAENTPITRRLHDAMQSSSPFDRSHLFQTLYRHDASIHAPRKVRLQRPFNFDRFLNTLSLTPTPTLEKAFNRVESHEESDIYNSLWLPSVRIGAIYAVGGSANCAVSQWLHANSHHIAYPIPSPRFMQYKEHFCGVQLHLLSVAGQAVAVRADISDLNQVDMTMQSWSGKRWNPEQRLLVRFDHTLGAAQVVCRTGGHCAVWRDAAMAAAKRFDRAPEPGTLTSSSAKTGTAYARLLRLAKGAWHQATAAIPYANNSLTLAAGGYTRFGTDAIYFPTRVAGQVLLGRIGHTGHIDTMRNIGWIIGFWKFGGNRHRLLPVAGAVVPRQVGPYLDSASLPTDTSMPFINNLIHIPYHSYSLMR
jgi:hypothetical protein